MTNSDSTFLGRREMAKSALLGGASFLLGAQTPARAEGPAASQERISVREFGATGDGKTDDTKAIQRALDAAGEVRGAVFVPPGVYLCAELQMPPNTALVGWRSMAPVWAWAFTESFSTSRTMESTRTPSELSAARWRASRATE